MRLSRRRISNLQTLCWKSAQEPETVCFSSETLAQKPSASQYQAADPFSNSYGPRTRESEEGDSGYAPQLRLPFGILADDPCATVELDPRMGAEVTKRVQGTPLAKKLEVILGDVIKMPELPQCDALISNTPYQISSPLIFKMLAMKNPPRVAVLMVSPPLELLLWLPLLMNICWPVSKRICETSSC